MKFLPYRKSSNPAKLLSTSSEHRFWSQPQIFHPNGGIERQALKVLIQTPFNSSTRPFHQVPANLPTELYPEASKEGEDKYEWYKKSKYGNSDEKMKMYTTLMSAYGVSAGIDYKFGGTVANTLNAHRVIQHFQESMGAETADKIVNSLYRQYFEEEKHPSTDATLLEACNEAGVPEKEAKEVVKDEYEGLQEVKGLIREQAGNGIDSVPYIVIEGKRRDVSLQGAQEVEDYVKALNQIVKESG